MGINMKTLQLSIVFLTSVYILECKKVTKKLTLLRLLTMMNMKEQGMKSIHSPDKTIGNHLPHHLGLMLLLPQQQLLPQPPHLLPQLPQPKLGLQLPQLPQPQLGLILNPLRLGTMDIMELQATRNLAPMARKNLTPTARTNPKNTVVVASMAVEKIITGDYPGSFILLKISSLQFLK